ncbi:unnamed protein product, partial [Cylicostephanus goldi]
MTIFGYLNFLVDHRDELGVTLDNISSLFGCIERIYAFNRKLLQQLDSADLDCVKNMLKHLPSTLPPDDFAVVKRAHEVMTSQASRINDEKKRAEHAERVEQLQAAIQKWTVDKVRDQNYHNANLSAYGELLLEAQFRQAGSKTIRLLFLFEEMLLIVKQRNSSYVCKDYIMSSNLMLNESICPEEPLAFQVLSFDNPRTHYIFLASSADQKRTWMTELKRMMLDH